MADTNNFAFPYLEQALQINATMLGLPILLLVVAGCLGLACLLFAVPTFPNKWIPSVTILWGLFLNLVGTPLTTVANFVRALILGLVAGAVSWILFKKFGQRWVSPDTFKQNGDTEHTTKL